MPKTKDQRKKNRKRRRRTQKGGKAFSGGIVSLTFVDNTKGNVPLGCPVCGVNKYEEVVSTLGKSKVRSMAGNFFFGDGVDTLDNTSVIAYFCMNCGSCRMIRNNEKIRIVSTPIRN